MVVQPPQPKAIAITKPASLTLCRNRRRVDTLSVPDPPGLTERQADEKSRPFADLGAHVDAAIMQLDDAIHH